MKIFRRIIGDTLLIAVLFSLLFLPFGTISLSGVGTTEVLSETTQYTEEVNTPAETYNKRTYEDFKYPFEDPNYIDRAITNTQESSASEGQQIYNGQDQSSPNQYSE